MRFTSTPFVRLKPRPHGPSGSRYQTWKRRTSPGAQPPLLFRAGPQLARPAASGVLAVLGRPQGGEGNVKNVFNQQGPEHKTTLTMTVGSAEKAYEEMIFRDKNIAGGLKTLPDGRTVFETHDPDGVKVVFLEGGE